MNRRSLARFVGGLAVAAVGGLASQPCPAEAGPKLPYLALPSEIQAALKSAKLPESALAVWVQEVGADARAQPPRLAWNAKQPFNPASVFKLLSTYAALDMLGPAWRWRTPIYLIANTGAPAASLAQAGSPPQMPDGASSDAVVSAPPETSTVPPPATISADGVLHGSVAIRASGDPTLTLERLWLLLRRLQQLGVREIAGDIVLDRSAWRLPAQSAADFDGEPSRPYNVRPDALLLNLKALTLTLSPQPERGLARISADLALDGVRWPASVPLSDEPCSEWRTALLPDFSDPAQPRLNGRFPAACGETGWPLAFAEPASFNARLLIQLWRELGGRLGGRALEGTVPAGAMPAFEVLSPPLAEVVRDINKFSNNVMAEQLYLSLGAARYQRPVAPPDEATLERTAPGCAVADGTTPQQAEPDTAELARATLQAWLEGQLGPAAAQGIVIANGSGLAREGRISAQQLGQLLQKAWQSPVMPELLSSLPVSGTDGTAKRLRAAPGRAHLKTGSLRDVVALAGEVMSAGGRRWLLVALINHPQAQEGRPVLDALVQWAQEDAAPH